MLYEYPSPVGPSAYESPFQEFIRPLRQLVEHLLTIMMGGPGREFAPKFESAVRRAVGDDYLWPGNVRELEQAIRRILLTGQYATSAAPKSATLRDELIAGLDSEQITADELVSSYCKLLYQKHGIYEAVGRIANLDRRTVKKHLQGHDRAQH